jgi:hypothetical protein
MTKTFLTKKQLAIVYDCLYEKADEIIKRYDPCRFTDGRCVGQNGGCCGGCKHLSNNGCTIQCLACKTWLCNKIKDDPQHMKLRTELALLRVRYHYFIYCFGSCRTTKDISIDGIFRNIKYDFGI